MPVNQVPRSHSSGWYMKQKVEPSTYPRQSLSFNRFHLKKNTSVLEHAILGTDSVDGLSLFDRTDVGVKCFLPSFGSYVLGIGTPGVLWLLCCAADLQDTYKDMASIGTGGSFFDLCWSFWRLLDFPSTSGIEAYEHRKLSTMSSTHPPPTKSYEEYLCRQHETVPSLSIMSIMAVAWGAFQ